jgi:alpha-L-fucosidase
LAQGEKDEEGAPPEVVARWQDMRFGMFVHWGPVSLKGTEIGWSRGAQIPVAEYDTLYQKFKAEHFNADDWARTAKEAGMKYLVLTTKHHDGFCLWDTKLTDHNVMRSPFGRDVVKELSAACRKQGIAFGTYYSTCDWHHPDFPLTSPGGRVKRDKYDLERYTVYLKGQVKELITNYGPLSTLWFDVPQQFDKVRGQAVIDFVRSLQPDIVINNRSGARGDYDTPEQRVGGFQVDRPWETCMTICRQWAWKPDDQMKSLEQCLRTLVMTNAGDGNLLFNVGPMPDGRIEPRQVERLKEMGAWLAQHGESIYGTRGGPLKPGRGLATTRKGNSIYLHVFPEATGQIEMPKLPRKVTAAQLLGGGAVELKESGERWVIALPAAMRKPIDTIIKIDLDGSAMDLAPVGFPTDFGAAKASNVFQKQTAHHGAAMAFDGDPESRWATDGGTSECWLEAALGRPGPIRGIEIDEAREYAGRVQSFTVKVEVAGAWQTVAQGTKLGKFAVNFDPVAATAVRLEIAKASDGPTISEVRVKR